MLGRSKNVDTIHYEHEKLKRPDETDMARKIARQQ
jgi:hypothetical protein